MNVYVDVLRPYKLSIYGRPQKWCHLFVSPDTKLEVLHKFAESIGLRRKYFQNKKALPHYDLVASKRKLAVSLGAVEVDLEFTARMIKIYKLGDKK